MKPAASSTDAQIRFSMNADTAVHPSHLMSASGRFFCQINKRGHRTRENQDARDARESDSCAQSTAALPTTSFHLHFFLLYEIPCKLPGLILHPRSVIRVRRILR